MTEQGFKEYLINEGKSEKTIQNYLSAFTFINSVIEENKIPKIEDWDTSNTDLYFNQIIQDETFKVQNTKGNNMYSVSLGHYIKYMKQEIIIPQLPFDSFGWRWATTGIASYLNKPESLKIILDALLINGNGEDNYTQEFKDLIHKLCINKYNISHEESEKLTKLSNPSITKNIIENSANYWYHLGLLKTTGRNTEVSDLGESFLNGLLSNDEFILNRIENYSLPNKAYKTTEIKKWNTSELKIYPLKLIQVILTYLINNYESEQHYITESDLTDIIIPCSYDIDKFTIAVITDHIIKFRKEPDKYSSWPKPQSNYTDDKGLRMANEFLYFLEVFGFLSSDKNSSVRSNDKKYIATSKFIEVKENESNNKTSIKSKPIRFKIEEFTKDSKNSGLTYSNQIITRYISALATKPFVLLSGLSGSGKTKLAQSFTQWICEDDTQYCIVPVGADWTNREPLLGYVNALDNTEYILPENGALQLLINANANQDKPYFLILDEMNLSHVERYFADFLSVMESKDTFKLHSGTCKNVNENIKWPKNLFVVGTVNIDETTYMFSPKVLDRANTIEFRVNKSEIEAFLNAPKEINLDQLKSKGVSMATSFIEMTQEKKFTEVNTEKLTDTLVSFFTQLKKTGAEFGYRTGMEIHRLYQQLSVINSEVTENEKIDIAIMQKLLPKLHGSRRKLCPILEILANLCIKGNDVKKDFLNNTEEIDFKGNEDVVYPLALEKIIRMYKGAIDNGFASYAEA